VAVEHPEQALLDEFDNDFMVVPWDAPNSDIEVRVRGTAQQGWTISNDVEDNIAQAQPGRFSALVAGLHAYALQNNVLRMALRRCNDPELAGRLSVSILDCAAAGGLADPTVDKVDALIDSLHEAPKVVGKQEYDGAYQLATGALFAFKITNSYRRATLHVTLLNCTAGGKVEYLGDESIRPGDRKVIWRGGTAGQCFKASPSMGRARALDRSVVLATTKPGVDLRYLAQPINIQQVIDREIGSKDIDEDRPGDELWTAVVRSVLMGD
jgi:hypothetical protein